MRLTSRSIRPSLPRPDAADEFGTVDSKKVFKKNYANPLYHHRLPPLTLQTIDDLLSPAPRLFSLATHPGTPL